MAARRHLNILLSLILALAAILLPLLGIAGAAGITANETPLNPSGSAYELNLEGRDTLWVSDLGAGEIWSFDTTSGAHIAYRVGGKPSDARGDGAGSVWWANYGSNRLGRLSTSTNQATVWEIPGSAGLYGTAIDGSGDVWVSDAKAAFIYKLDPSNNQLCTYTLPNTGRSEYLYVHGEQLWLGDYMNRRIVRLQGGAFDWWNLPANSYPRDMEMDENGRLWWTDLNKGYLGQLDSAAATITTFTPPASDSPVMLTLSGGKAWASQQGPSRVVELDPAVAASQTAQVTHGSEAVTPACGPLAPLAQTAVTTTSGQANWTGQTYTTAVDAGGWVMYDMPTGSAPWGIAATDDNVWLIDKGRKVLVRLGESAPPSTNVYLPLVQRQ